MKPSCSRSRRRHDGGALVRDAARVPTSRWTTTVPPPLEPPTLVPAPPCTSTEPDMHVGADRPAGVAGDLERAPSPRVAQR